MLSRAERTDYLAAVGLKEAGLDRLIRAGYALLDLVTYFTAGPKETRAWTITRGTKAPQAAGVIHTDFERGFIRAETIAYDDYVTLRRRGRRARRRQAAARRQGLRGRRRRRHAFQVCDLILLVGWVERSIKALTPVFAGYARGPTLTPRQGCWVREALDPTYRPPRVTSVRAGGWRRGAR